MAYYLEYLLTTELRITFIQDIWFCTITVTLEALYMNINVTELKFLYLSNPSFEIYQ